MIVKKKKYQIPTIETISLGIMTVMVPDEMSDPIFGGANTSLFEEDENEDWGEENSYKSNGKLWK